MKPADTISMRIIRLHCCSPKLTAPQIAAQLGCPLTYVHKVKARRGLRIPPDVRIRAEGRVP